MTDYRADVPFMKMHGLGNDFVVIDRRELAIDVTPAFARNLGDRHRGIGFDQLAIIDAEDGVDARLTFWNSDGSLSAACGNATRCIARLLMQNGAEKVTLRTGRGDLSAVKTERGETSVNMGPPVLGWQDIPLLHDVDTLHLPMDGDPVGTGMGNPHCTFFVDDVAEVDLGSFGRMQEYHPLFPERTNVQVAHPVGEDHLRVRVYERGVGITLASGSSACAVVVASARRGITGRHVRVDLDGGRMDIDWRDDGVWMTGPTAHVADGVLRAEWLASL